MSWIAKRNLKLAKKVQFMKVAAAARVIKTGKSVKLYVNKSHKVASLLLKWTKQNRSRLAQSVSRSQSYSSWPH